MDAKTLAIILIPSTLSILLAAANMIFNYFRDKKKREDKVWDTAEQITLAFLQKQQYGLMEEETVDEAIVFFDRTHRLLGKVDDGSLAELVKAMESHKSRIESGTILPDDHPASPPSLSN